MTGPETRLRKRIVKALKKAFPGSAWHKIHGNKFQNRGISDLLGCVQGWYFALEIKILGKSATPNQEAFIAEIHAAKGAATVIYNPKQAVDFVKQELMRRSINRIDLKEEYGSRHRRSHQDVLEERIEHRESRASKRVSRVRDPQRSSLRGIPGRGRRGSL